MNLKTYQKNNIKKIVDSVLEQLDIDGMRRKIVFQAPTGSGKTVMVTEAMCRIHETIADSDCQYNKVAFIWIAPNALHIQSYHSMKNAFTETHRLTPVVYDELDLGHEGYIHPGEVFFVNWQSIYQGNKNIMVRGSEQISSIYEIIARTTQEHHTPIVCIIDEEHMFSGSNAAKSEKVLAQINPKVELRISATPETKSHDAYIKIERSQVVSEGMIKNGISLNPAIRGNQAEEAMDIHLLREAMKRRNTLAKAYSNLGVDINPLLLIQLPNDSSDSMTDDEVALKDSILSELKSHHNCSVDNGKTAVWLSTEKQNLDGIEKLNSMVDVMLFKQAVAMGWDCPRAAVLLILRKLSSETFTIQTVGRIMRMPQQHFYNDPMLNIGFVYTDLSADVIKIEPDSADYITMQYAYRKENLQNVELLSYREERSGHENNVLRSDFRRMLVEYWAEYWALHYQQLKINFDAEEENEDLCTNRVSDNRKSAEKYIQLNISRIQVEIPTDMNIVDEEGEIVVSNKTGFAKKPEEVDKVFEKFCLSMLGGWSKTHCITMLEISLIDAMKELFDIDEPFAKMVICSKQNQPKFADLIDKALIHYKEHFLVKRLKADRGIVDFKWTVPELREYKDSTYHEREGIQCHALIPYFEQNRKFEPERHFVDFLEDNSKYIDWWYKNADSGSQHFAIGYIRTDGVQSLFFVDFIIRMKSGKIFLFDTKSTGSDKEAPGKHNALIEYIKKENQKGQNLAGGVIVEVGKTWKYCPHKIKNTTDFSKWTSWFPDQN